jgi:hypothetical protein
MKVMPKLAEALVNLRGNRDFQTVLEGFKEHESEEVTRCVEGDGAIQLRASGAVKALRFWEEAFRDAPATLDKFKQQSIQQQQKLRGQNTP